MSRINTNVPSLIAQIHLRQSQSDLQVALDRLSTGLRINSGKDDPAGLIASEALGSDIAAIQKAISNTQQANEIIATADSALGQVTSLLNDIRGLVTESANTGALGPDQIAANQLQVDSSLEAINRIAAATSFQGKKLLDGTLNFITSGVTTADIAALAIQQATLPTSGSLSVSVDLTTAATKATVTGPSANLAAQAVVQVSGSKGAEIFTFGTGTTVAQIASAVQLVANAIGVDATVSGGAASFQAQDFGSAEFVSVQLISGGPFTGSGTRNTGSDAVGRVNGVAFAARGNTISLHTSTLSLTAELTTAFSAGSTSSFSITGGGALFQLGPDVVSTQQSRIGVESINVAELGGVVVGVYRRLYELRSGQAADLDSDTTSAFQIIDSVLNKVTTLRGRLGAFQRTTLDTNLESLNDTLGNITEAQSSIRDADFAVETARLTRAQILTQSGASVLQIANQSPQQVLSLLPRG